MPKEILDIRVILVMLDTIVHQEGTQQKKKDAAKEEVVDVSLFPFKDSRVEINVIMNLS